MGICWGDPRFPTPSHTGSLKSGIQLTISSSSSSGDGHHHNNLVPDDIGPFPNGSILADPCLKNFTLQELTAATENFRSDLLIGEGGFGQVYRGFISEGVALGGKKTVVAIKTLSGESMQGYREWMAEVQFLGTLSHPNIVKLLGFCSNDGQLLLVYEYMSRGSLNNHLYEKRLKDHPLSWASRLKIALGAARGMEFLHSSERAIIYRDFKSSNILLDRGYNAKLSDFGLALFVRSEGVSPVKTTVVGTYGYSDPEYISTGHLRIKSDVYSFGVVLLELLTGLRVIDKNRSEGKVNLVEWAKPRLLIERKVKAMADSRLMGKYPPNAVVQLAQIASRCLARESMKRPSMKEVVEALEEINTFGKEVKCTSINS